MCKIDENDKYSEFEVCVICRRCKRFDGGVLSPRCAGKSAVIYAKDVDKCWNFEEKK